IANGGRRGRNRPDRDDRRPGGCRPRRWQGNRRGARGCGHRKTAGRGPPHHRRGHARHCRGGACRCGQHQVRGGARGGRHSRGRPHGSRRRLRAVGTGSAAPDRRRTRRRPRPRRHPDDGLRHAPAANAAGRRIRSCGGKHRRRRRRASAERERRYDGRASGGKPACAASGDRGIDVGCARRVGPDDPGARSVRDRTPGVRRHRDGRNDRKVAGMRTGAGGGRRRRADRRRPRSGGAADSGIGRGARRGDTRGDNGRDTIMTTTSTSALEEIQAREARYVLQTYRRNPVTFVRGEGVRLFDSEGREYFDLLSGIGVASLGHAHPGLARAIAEQAQQLLHTSNLFFHPLQGQVAEKLSAMSGLPRAFFCNSGTEAVEACLKFARRYWHTKGEPRAEFVALDESFHGRTFGALSVTSDEHYRQPFEPLLPGVTFVPVNDPAALLAAVSGRTAAIIAEPVQGEGGVRPLTPAFAAAINEACARTGALLICDEVQGGLGRTGVPFHFQTLGLKPHVVSLGKALGAGVPIGAALISEEVATTISYGDHGSTYGGNLLACRAALTFLTELVEGGVMENVTRAGKVFEQRLNGLAKKHAGLVKEVRGLGLIWGLDLTKDA